MLRLFIVCMIAAAPLSAIAADVETSPSARHSWSQSDAVEEPTPLRPGANIIALRRGAQVSHENQADTPKQECRTGVVGGGFCVLN